MKLIILTLSLTSSLVFAAETNTGRTSTGPGTLGQPSYPNSGTIRHRSNDMTGKDMSNSTLMGSDVDPRVPTRTPDGKQAQESRNIPKGPYDDSDVRHHEEGPKGIEAQEAAEEEQLDLSEKEIKRKQQGE